MKKFLFLISMIFCFSTIAFAGNDVPMNYHPHGSTHGGNGKAPVAPWYIDQDGNVLTMSATPCGYTLRGTYRIELIMGSWLFYDFIDL